MRLFQSMIGQFLIILIWIKYIKGYTIADIYNETYNFMRGNGAKLVDPKVYQSLKNTDLYILAPKHSNEELIETIVNRFQAKQDPEHEGDFIDVIINHLGKVGFAGNRISGEVTQLILKSILSTADFIELKKRLDKEEFTCGQCERPLQSGEVVTVLNEGKNRRIIYCTRCFVPEVAGCPGCAEHVPFRSRYSTKKFIDCGYHQKKEIKVEFEP